MDKPSAAPSSIVCVLTLLCCLTPGALGQWLQFGGPEQNFSVESGVLETDWSESGPPVIWAKPFGDGFSSILVDGDKIYSMYRRGQEDVVACLAADTGETIWQTSYPSPVLEDMVIDFGEGAIATPVIHGDRIFTVSLTVKLNALDKNTGEVLWSHDLMEEMGARHMGRGYGPSPVAFENLLILNVGAEGAGVVAFDQLTGEVVWKNLDFPAAYSSPVLGSVEGEDQLLVCMGNHRAGLDPRTGELKWHLELPASATSMMANQIWGPDKILFGSAAYSDGSRAIRISKDEGAFQAVEIWHSRKLRVMFSPFVRIGDYIYGSSGDFGPTFLMGINVKTGDVAWRERGFARTHFLHAGSYVILLDEEGDLAIASATPQGLTVHSRSKVLERMAWTPPSLVGTRLYLRNRVEIKALELAVQP